MTMTDYQKQGTDFLQKTNTAMVVKFNRQGKYFDDDKNERDIYDIALTRGSRSYTFTFGQSITKSGRFIKYNNPERSMSQGKLYKNSWVAPAGEVGYREWDKNKNFQIPTAYDVLSCVEKNDVGTFEEFCNEFGYDTDSRKAEKTYKAVKDQYTQFCTLYSDTEMQELSEIS